MGWISVIFIRKAMDVIGRDKALDILGAVLGQNGAERLDLSDPSAMIPEPAFFDFLETCVARHGPDIPLSIGAGMRCDDYGAFGLAFKTAPDLAGSFQRLERYGKVVTSIANFAVHPDSDGLRVQIIAQPGDRPGLRMTQLLAVSALVTICRETNAASFRPNRVEFAHPPPVDEATLNAHFACPLRFDAGRTGIVVPIAATQVPNRLGDAGISAFLSGHLHRELEAIPSLGTLPDTVRTRIMDALPNGIPGVTDIARQLGLSARTLQRRLQSSGHVFSDLLIEAQRDLALSLLKGTDHGLAEIAFLTGFADQSTFSRAFKRWLGAPPGAYRRKP